MAVVPAGMANENAFLAPVRPSLTVVFGPGLGFVLPDDDFQPVGTFPTPLLTPPGGGPPPTEPVVYEVDIYAEITIVGRVAESRFSSFQACVAVDPNNLEGADEDQNRVGSWYPRIGYALTGDVFDGHVAAIPGESPTFLLGIMREEGDTATYMLDKCIISYKLEA